jgi:hypothetical protein
MLRLLFLIPMMLLLLVLGFTPRPGLTQGGETCPPLVLQALASVADNCGSLARNSACYGFNRVDATFSETASVAEDFFSKPADRAGLNTLETVQTVPLDVDSEEWGVAVMSVQANVPNTLPGQAVAFILLGDVSLENAVAPEDAVEPAEQPLTLTTLVDANVRGRPSTRSNILGGVPTGTTLQADALSADKQWFRIVFQEKSVGWIFRDLVNMDGDPETLPVFGDEDRTPMQAFYFKTGIGDPTCNQSPSALVIQGPENVTVDITANGANIRISSTVMLQTTEDNVMEITTLNGEVSADGINIPAGYQVEVPLTDDGHDLDGQYRDLHPLTRSELEDIQWLDNIPSDILNYPIDVPQQAFVRPTPVPQSKPPTTQTAPNSGGPVNCTPFKATSPVDGLAFGLNTFYWDPAPGATSYRVTVVGFRSAETAAPNTHLSLDLYEAGINFQMSWYVEALLNGNVACTSQTVTIPREASPPPFSASWQCGPGADQVTITYSNAPPDSNSVINQIYTLELEDTRPVPPYSASVSYNFGGYYFNSSGAVIAQPSGQSVSLPDISCGDTASS